MSYTINDIRFHAQMFIFAPTTMSFVQLAGAVVSNGALHGLDFSTVKLCYGLVRHLKPTLAYLQPSYVLDPPEMLPVNVQNFLVLAVGIPDEIVKHLWELKAACRNATDTGEAWYRQGGGGCSSRFSVLCLAGVRA